MRYKIFLQKLSNLECCVENFQNSWSQHYGSVRGGKITLEIRLLLHKDGQINYVNARFRSMKNGTIFDTLHRKAANQNFPFKNIQIVKKK